MIEDSGDFSTSQNISKDELDPVLKSLTAENYIVLAVIERRSIELTAEGTEYAQKGSPEFQFADKMAFEEKCDKAEMEKRCGAQVVKIG